MNYSIKNILVPTDFSECANNALRVAIGMAKRHNATLHLLHCVEKMYFGQYVDIHSEIIDYQVTLLNTASESLNKHKDKILELEKIPMKVSAEVGVVYHKVNDYAEKNNIDIIVMGTHGASGFKEFFAGTNTYDVIKAASCPVISIPISFAGSGFNSVLFPLRAVDGVVEKYDFIKPILEKNDATIHLLGIAFENDTNERYVVNYDFEKLKELIQLDHKYMTYEGIQTTDVADTVLTVANKRSDDLIIINATLDKKWYQFFKGNYTQKIINHSRIPIMAVKPELTPSEIDMANQYLVSEANYYTPLNL